LKDIKMRFLAF